MTSPNWLILFRHYHPAHIGGTTTYVRRFVKALVNQGHNVTIITPRYDDVHPDAEMVDGICVEYVDVGKSILGPLRFRERATFSAYVKNHLSAHKYDYVNIHDGFTVAPRLLKHIRGMSKLVYTAHAVTAWEYIFDLYKMMSRGSFSLKKFFLLSAKAIIAYPCEFRACLYADDIVVMSSYVKGTLGKWYRNVPGAKVHVSAIGPDEDACREVVSMQEARTRLGIPEGKKVFITVRRLEPRMGLHNLVTAWSKISAEAVLYIAGKGSLYRELQLLIQKNSLCDRVFLLGFVSNQNLHLLHKAADCFVLPTEELEGFGIVTIDALFYGLPVIGTPCGATPEILKNFHPELITSDAGPDAIAAKVEHFIGHSEKYRISDNSRYVLELYSWKQIIDYLLPALGLS